MATFRCPKCGTRKRIPDALAGLNLGCEQCDEPQEEKTGQPDRKQATGKPSIKPAPVTSAYRSLDQLDKPRTARQKNSRRSLVLLLCLLTLVLIPVGYWLYPRASNGSVSAEPSATASMDAWNVTQKFIRNWQRPKTVDFGTPMVLTDGFQDDTTCVRPIQGSENEYLVRGWVDVRDTNGNVARNDFSCHLQNDGGNWRCFDIRMTPQEPENASQ